MRKLLSVTLAVTTALWLVGSFFIFIPTAKAAVANGDIVSPNATFVDADGNTYQPYDVFIIKLVGAKKFKRLVLNPQVFDSYNHLKWSNIRKVSADTVKEYATSSLVREINDTKVYKLVPDRDTGIKQWVDDLACFNSKDYDWDSVYIINATDRDNYTTGISLCGTALSFKIAVIYIHEKNPEASKEIQQLEQNKKIWEEMFNYAGRGLVNFDFSYLVAEIKITDQNRDKLVFLNPDGKYSLNFDPEEFYKNNPDIFDFLAPFDGFETSTYGSGLSYSSKQNKIEGIGLSIFDDSKQYGSNDKLLGIIYGLGGVFKNANAYNVGKLLLHEISHQWGVFIGNAKNQGDLVLIDSYGAHWEKGLNVGYDPLAVSNSKFKDNNDGTFTVLPPSEYWFLGDERNEPVPKLIYSDLSLYLMGALPPEKVEPILWLDIPNAQMITPNGIIQPQETKFITIETIINKYGKRKSI